MSHTCACARVHTHTHTHTQSHKHTCTLQWSFGVVLWELMTLGMMPYEDTPPEEMLACLTAGQRLYQPKSCPDEL